MNHPTFLIIGAAKAGTSAVFDQLGQHPGVFASPRKEPHFFAFEGEEVHFTTPPGVSDPMRRIAITGWPEYQALFEGADPSQASGEASTQYLYVPGTAERIHRRVPSVRLLCILRDPVSRAYSAYLHKRRDDQEPIEDFVEALRAEPRRIAENWGLLWRYADGGRYATQLKRYLRVFDREQLRVYLYDDLRRDPLGTVRDMYRFIGADDAFEPDVGRQRNVSGLHRSGALRRLYRAQKNPTAVRLAKALLPSGMRARIKHDVLMPMHQRDLRKPPLPDAARAWLHQALDDEVRELQDLIGRDLGAWLERGSGP